MYMLQFKRNRGVTPYKCLSASIPNLKFGDFPPIKLKLLFVTKTIHDNREDKSVFNWFIFLKRIVCIPSCLAGTRFSS